MQCLRRREAMTIFDLPHCFLKRAAFAQKGSPDLDPILLPLVGCPDGQVHVFERIVMKQTDKQHLLSRRLEGDNTA